MITERLFCVKLCEAGFLLQPGASAHPKVHSKGQKEYDRKSDVEHWSGCPARQIAKRFEEVHAEIPCEKGQRHEQNGDDRQRFHDLIHPIVDCG